jgi:hypothetical protein
MFFWFFCQGGFDNWDNIKKLWGLVHRPFVGSEWYGFGVMLLLLSTYAVRNSGADGEFRVAHQLFPEKYYS